MRPAVLHPTLRAKSLASAVSAAAAVLTFGQLADAAQPPSPLATAFGNTIVCQSKASGHVCELWIDANGDYKVFYDFGPQPKPPVDSSGPFQFEGREGRWRLIRAAGSAKLCLQPAPPPAPLAMDRAKELFGVRACYVVAPHPVGDIWEMKDADGRAYKVWLLQGR